MGVFGDLNEVKIIGNLTQDPELRRTSSGTAVVNVSIATNRSYKVNEEWKEETEFHNAVIWGNDAEIFCQRSRKGTRLFVNGRLQTRSWEDQAGTKKYKTEIVAEKVILLDRYERGNAEHSDTSFKNSEDTSHTSVTVDPDDLPF